MGNRRFVGQNVRLKIFVFDKGFDMKSFFDRCCTRYRVVCCVAGAVVFSNIHVAGARQAHSVPDEPKSDRVSQLIRKMTIEEKVAQLRVFHSNLGVELDKNGKLELLDEVKDKLKVGIAGIKNPGTYLPPEEGIRLCNQLQKYIIENNRLGIPAFFVTECYSGVDAINNTHLARPITMASSWNPELVRKSWDIVGREARARGMHLCHSPEGDLARDPRFGRMSETFGEDTYLASRMLLSAVRGVQGDGVGLKGTHIGACVKHFAGYSQVEGGRNFASVQISPRSFIDEILPTFETAVRDGQCAGIMASHADINGIASHANPQLLTETLRNQWGFDGYVISDATDVERLHSFMKVAESYEEAAIMALSAGMDIDLYGENGYALLVEIISKKPQLERLLDRSVERVLRTKEKLGLFDNPYFDEKQTAVINRSQASLELALKTDLESIILLKNEKEILPLKSGAKKKIAVIGPLAGPGQVELIRKAAGPDAIVRYAKGCEIAQGSRSRPSLVDFEEDLPLIQEAKDLAEQSDIVLVFLGGDERTAKEAYFGSALGDRDSLDPVGQQNYLMQQLQKTKAGIVLVLKHRRTLSISVFDECSDAILDCWELSERGDEAITQILFGQVNPSGKLPVTVPRSVGQLPCYYSQKHINYKKGYLFTKSDPLYDFGHGLSYTQFEYSNLKIDNKATVKDGYISITFDVTNIGKRTGKEVCQLYVKDMIGSVVRPDKELKDFVKLELKPGQTRNVRFVLNIDKLAFTGKDMLKTVEPGEFKVTVGTSSKTGLEGGFSLK
jgi:beta-glucosidase